ncbi:hypothetical protein [Aurantimonas marianensis]|uniref:Uncharacterized protein n=1 Tax=Aurantimonas marianensis TaxID=2920428 RepID=A0A9X2HAR5_9HYPH|nr:hypothetical protein [Aurantimonas marianensis]MCP3056328.1 hypothetical protein [Aurantimonas marianensis]
MAKDNTDNSSNDIADTLERELSDEFGKAVSQAPKSSSNRFDPKGPTPVGLPRRIAGGFLGLRDDLDESAREWRNVSRAIAQQRPLVETLEAERGALLESLAKAAEEALADGKALALLVESTKNGDVSGNLAERFDASLDTLEQLAGVSSALTGNLLSLRSSWEQYFSLVLKGQDLQEGRRPE